MCGLLTQIAQGKRETRTFGALWEASFVRLKLISREIAGFGLVVTVPGWSPF